MAHVRKLKSGRWRAEYRDGSGRRHSLTRDTKRDALASAAEEERRLRHGTWIDPADAGTTLGAWVKVWRQHHAVSRTTAAKVAWHLDAHIIPDFGDVPLNKISRLSVQQWVKAMSAKPSRRAKEGEERTLAPGTVAGIYRTLALVLGDAVHEGLLPASPCRRIVMPKDRRAERLFAEPAMVLAIADGVPAHHRTMILTAAWTGMRWEEVTGLQRADCQLLRRQLVLTHALHQTGNRRWVDEHMKSNAAYRTVTLPPFLVDLLAEHLASTPRRPGCPECGGEMVFTGEQGALLSRTFGTRIFRPAVVRAGGGALTFHGLRHSHEAWLISDGTPQVAIDQRMGHATRGMVGVYGHVLDEVRTRMVDGLQRRWLDARGSVPVAVGESPDARMTHESPAGR